MALDGLGTVVECARKETCAADGADAELALSCARALLSAYDIPEGVAIRVHQSIPRHAGLGSGTQMALAVGTAVSRLFHLNLSARDIALRLNRGVRSGIGIGAFEQGGFLLDGGRGERTGPPRILARHPFPAHWRIVLLLAGAGGAGLSGHPERAAFRALPEFPPGDAARLSRAALMGILPALLEEDLQQFALGIGELQRVVGDYFAPAQGGRFMHPQVRRALACAEQRGFRGVGQSSWGPTGFVLADSDAQARALARDLRAQLPELRILTLAAANHPHRFEERPDLSAGAPRSAP